MAQEPSSSSQIIETGQIASEHDLELLRQDLRAKKQQIIGENLRMTDDEAKRFWPIYNHYTNFD
jgi:hypothetical protein